MISKVQEADHLSLCPECRYGRFQVPVNGQEWHLECDNCDTILFCYRPMPHQEAFHKDRTKFRMFAGGYGSAKTTTACAEIIHHILTTPRGATLIGAETLPQLEQTAQKTFFEMFPEQLIETYNKQKNYIDTITGHRVLFRPLDDEGKAKSLNLTSFWMEEASEVHYEYFVQLQTRLRNAATDHHMGILSTNPDLGWIKTDFLLVSTIHNAEVDEYIQDASLVNPTFSTHIAPTKLNIYLPPTYEADVARGKPEWWILRFLKGSFSHAEGLVYPIFAKYAFNMAKRFPDGIPAQWEKAQASDFGLRDPTTALWGAIDPSSGDVYFYDVHYQTEEGVDHHAAEMTKRLEQIPIGRLRFLVGDPKGEARGTNDRGSIFDHYNEYGIYFSPANNRLDDGILKVFTWFKLGKIHYADHLKWLIYEFERYKYPERKLQQTKVVGEKPVDKDNHLMDALRYFIQELPDDPKHLINPSFLAKTPQEQMSQNYLPFALRDDTPFTNNDWISY